MPIEYPPRIAETLSASINAQAYTELVVDGRGSTEGRRLLDGATAESLLGRPPADREAGEAVLAGLWLWHDWLDESHTISQSIASATGSFWHAIMHRREGDFGNSQYWYARCRRHPALGLIAAEAGLLLQSLPPASAARVGRDGWDPDAFVDLVQQVHRRPDDPARSVAIDLQRLEWRVLFEWCLAKAV